MAYQGFLLLIALGLYHTLILICTSFLFQIGLDPPNLVAHDANLLPPRRYWAENGLSSTQRYFGPKHCPLASEVVDLLFLVEPRP